MRLPFAVPFLLSPVANQVDVHDVTSVAVGLSDADREELGLMLASRTLASVDVFRANLILMLADGKSYAEIQARLRTTAPTISRWKKRFAEHGIAGLMPRAAAASPP
jgi:hypothetical protein